jgi:hypothetical protein
MYLTALQSYEIALHAWTVSSSRGATLLFRLTACLPADALQGFKFAPENEDYMVPVAGPSSAAEDGTPMKSNLRLFPPPLFSRQAVQQNYKLRCVPNVQCNRGTDKLLRQAIKPILPP